jgi:hypothetical protein
MINVPGLALHNRNGCIELEQSKQQGNLVSGIIKGERMKKVERYKTGSVYNAECDAVCLISYCAVLKSDLDALEAERDEMLEALIAYRDDIAEEWQEETGIYIDDIIEKATCKRDEIKENEG